MIRAATVAALALAPTAPAMAEPDALYKDMTTFNDVVRNGAVGDVDGLAHHIDRSKLLVYFVVIVKDVAPGSAGAIYGAQAWGKKLCDDLSWQQHFHSSTLAWHVTIETPSPGALHSTMPVWQCTLGGNAPDGGPE
jgi:hypothetical protein